MRKTGLKSDLQHPYQKATYPFWRRPENAQLYSDETKHKFELHKIEFDTEVKYIQWVKKSL